MLAFLLNNFGKGLSGFDKLANARVGDTLAEQSLLVLGVLLKGLAGVFDRMVVLLNLHITVRQVSATGHLYLLDEFDSLLLVCNHRILLHLEEHLHPQKSLVVVGDRLLVILFLHAEIAIESLDIGHLELLLVCLHRVVLDDHFLVLCADRFLVIELLKVRRLLFLPVFLAATIFLIVNL